LNIPTFDQSKIRKDNGKLSLTPEAEAVRLSNELRSKPAKTFIDNMGKRINISAKRGFDCETADFETMVNWLADTRIKKSESLIVFVHRVLSIRFSQKYAQLKDKIDGRYKIEQELIQSNSKNDIFWLGEVGFANLVRSDDSLTDSRNKVIISRSGEIRIKRK